MKKRVFSLLLALVMIFSILPTAALADSNAVGDGTAQNPYQIGDVVSNDGSAQPQGATVENSYWVRTSDVPAQETLSCELDEHDHALSGCEKRFETVACTLEDHPTEGDVTTYTHPDGITCTFDASQGAWVTSRENGYACDIEPHAHTKENGCYTIVPAYTTWTLTEKEQQYGDLVISKTVRDSKNRNAGTAYSFSVTLSDRNAPVTFSLKHGESYTIEDVPYDTTYTVRETSVPDAYISSISDPGNGKIQSAKTTVTVVNEYKYTSYNNGLNLVKLDSKTNAPIQGAKFTLYSNSACTSEVASAVSDASGHLNIPVPSAGTYYLKETSAPAGYHPNNTVYTVTATETYLVKNAGTADAVTEAKLQIRVDGLVGTSTNQIDYVYTVKNTAVQYVDVTVKKVWAGISNVTPPESVKVVLYRNGDAIETVTLNKSNSWSYVWEDLSDAYTWTLDEIDVPAGYVKKVTNEGYDFTITNTKEFEDIEVSVKKVWYDVDKNTEHDPIRVYLYRDGEKYGSVYLSDDNNWKHTWEGLTDEFEWTVDEANVPEGYKKSISRSDYAFTIKNIHKDVPATGDNSSVDFWCMLFMVNLCAFSAAAYFLVVSYKKSKAVR